MKIKVINGPNLNMLGIREPGIYGSTGYDELVSMIEAHAKEKNIEVKVVQSNHEGTLVDEIQDCYGKFDGIVINPGAYTHTSIAILDAAKAVAIPVVEIHISDVDAREDFRKISYIRNACIATVSGPGLKGYLEAMDILLEKENDSKI